MGQTNVVVDVLAERDRQRVLYPEQTLPSGTGLPGDADVAAAARFATDRAVVSDTLTWRDVLTEEFREALAETDRDLLRDELIQVAAVCISWCEDIDRKAAP